VELEERDHFEQPLSEAEIQGLAAEAGLSQLFDHNSPSLKRMGLEGQELSDAEKVDLMVKNPPIIRRPLVRIGGRLLVGANIDALDAALREAG
jgi:arsenate reductase-like glutaredoxin family protein